MKRKTMWQNSALQTHCKEYKRGKIIANDAPFPQFRGQSLVFTTPPMMNLSKLLHYPLYVKLLFPKSKHFSTFLIICSSYSTPDYWNVSTTRFKPWTDGEFGRHDPICSWYGVVDRRRTESIGNGSQDKKNTL